MGDLNLLPCKLTHTGVYFYVLDYSKTAKGTNLLKIVHNRAIRVNVINKFANIWIPIDVSCKATLIVHSEPFHIA